MAVAAMAAAAAAATEVLHPTAVVTVVAAVVGAAAVVVRTAIQAAPMDHHLGGKPWPQAAGAYGIVRPWAGAFIAVFLPFSKVFSPASTSAHTRFSGP